MVDPVTKLPSGYSTGERGTWQGDALPLPNFVGHVEWFDDFLFLNTAGVYTAQNFAGGTTGALLDAITEPSGVVRLTSVSANSDEPAIQLDAVPFQFRDGKKLWFEARVRIPEFSSTSWEVALQTLNATQTNRDGVALAKLTGNTNMQVILNGAGFTPLVIDDAPINVADQWYKPAMYWDGDDLHIYLDGVFKQTISGSQPNIPKNTNLAPTFYMLRQNPTTRTADLDYFNIIAER